MGLSKKTLSEFREYLTNWTLQKIRDLFESEDIALAENYDPQVSGERRTLIAKYLHSVDHSRPDDIAKLVRTFEHVLVQLTGLIEDEKYPSYRANAERSLSNLIRWLQRDGFSFRDGRLSSTDTNASGTGGATQTAPPTPPVAEPMPTLIASPSATDPAPTAFVSYSWDSDEHKRWVLEFATKLRTHGVDAKLDQWDIVLGDPLPQFMEAAVRQNDFVLIVLTENYRAKSDSRTGGVGYEGHVMTAEVFSGADHRKFIPVLRAGDWKSSSPSWLLGKAGVDLRGSPYSEEQFDDLVQTLRGTRAKAPPLGGSSKATRPATEERSNEEAPSRAKRIDDPIRIVNIIASEVGTPRNDGTRGSALYAVPFQLSRRPSAEWSEHFVKTWDRPPSWSTRHRPGIARIEGDRLILDGTTVDEVSEVHRDTLKGVIDKVNADIAEHEARQRQLAERRAEELRKHRESVAEAASRLSFDDLKVEVRSFYYQDMREYRDSLVVITGSPRRYRAEIGFTNLSGQPVYVKQIRLTVDGRTYEQRMSSGTKPIEAREYREIDVAFPVEHESAVRSGEFELEVIPTVGNSARVTGTFPL